MDGTMVGMMEMDAILSFGGVVDWAIRSESASELGALSPARSFASLVDSAIRSSNASAPDVTPSPSPVHAYEITMSTTTERKKPDHTVSKGHKNYDLMLNLQLGIRHSIGKQPSFSRDLRLMDFDPKNNYWTRFPQEGSKFTPPHQSADFRWKDYYPVVFKHLRAVFGIDPADFMLAICGDNTLSVMSSPRKSGSFFFLAQNRFIIKTLKKSELKVLIRMLPSYFLHVCRYNNSLVTKFLGVHCVKHTGGQKTRFVVMSNVLCSEYVIHKRFDLKGSSYGRTTHKPREEIDETTTLKDLDLYLFFRLERSWFQELKRQLDRDCEFLEAEGKMDYSFLFGIHFRDDSSVDEVRSIPISQRHQIQLGTNIPAIAESLYKPGLNRIGSSNSTPSESDDEVYDVILYFGIINILQDYDISKKLEHAYKSRQVDPSSISAVDPKLYSRRFRDFMDKMFVEDK